MMESKQDRHEVFLQKTFDHIIGISKGNCSITDQIIDEAPTLIERKILEGLLYLHEDMELYKVELRQAVEAEYKLKAMEEKNKELEQFNYIASHDLQEPLRTISSFSRLLNKQYSDKLDASANEYLGFIVASSIRMSALIKGLLSFSRLGTGRVLTQIDCAQMLAAIRQDLQASIEEKNAHFDVEELPTLVGFELELRQVFQNLISNALKFNDPTRPIKITITCKQLPEGYLFCIRDNGIGIEAKDFQRIFDIFQCLHVRGKYEGTGIGLSNCRKIVELHGGEIWVESQVGVGSAFFFRIPFLPVTA